MNEPASGPEFVPELALEDLRWLRALAARLVRDPHTADDAVQETLVAALERPRATSSVRAWLSAILRNALRQEWRGRARRAKREGEARPAQSERSTLEVVEELALHRRLVERVQALDEPYRAVVVMRYLRGQDVAAIARELDLPPKTVRTRLARALAELRERLGSEREAWLLILSPAPAPALPPALTTLLLPMNVKAIAAALGLLLMGALFYLRSSHTAAPGVEPRATPTVSAATPAVPAPLEAPRTSAERAALPSTPATAPEVRSVAERARAEVAGFVRTLDGRGVAGVEVVFEAGANGSFLAAPDAPSARSGPAGEFVLPCPAHAGRLDLRSDEYVGVVQPQLDGTAPLAAPIVVAAPLRSYAGTVVDEAGAPLARARVEITLAGSFVQSRDVGGESVHLLLPFAETTCDERGAFRFERAGYVPEALLAASADGYRDGELALPPTSSASVELVLTLAPVGPRTLAGVVLDERDEPVEGARVSLGAHSVASDADGRFRLECETWRKDGWIRALRAGSLPAELALAQALAESSSEHALVLRLGTAPRAIRGRLLDADGKPVVGARVWTPDTTPFGEVVLREGENSFLGGTTVEAFLAGSSEPWSSQVSAVTDAHGRFALAGLLERGYALFALDARTLEGVGPIEAHGGDEDVVLRLASAPRAAVAGRVVSRLGVPLAGVTVTPGRRFEWRADEGAGAGRWVGFAIRSPPAAQAFPESAVVTDAEGRFALSPLVVDGAYLALRGKALALGAVFELDGAPDPAALEVAVDASSRFRVSLARASEADAFRLEDGDGEHVPLFLEVEGVTISAPSASIARGQSGVVLVAEGEHELVLLDGDEEVRRVRLQFPAGGLHELRP